MQKILFNQVTRLTFSTTKLRERFVGTLRPFSRHAITLSPYCQRRCAVARPMPKRQQIAFHGVRSDRAQTSLASSGSSQRNQPSASSIRVMRNAGRWRQTHWAGLAAHAIGKLNHHRGPRVEITGHANGGQTPHHLGCILEPRLNDVRRSIYPRAASLCLLP